MRARIDGGRAASTAIYFLLARGERSHWHRVDAVEVWHFTPARRWARDRSQRQGRSNASRSDPISPPASARRRSCRRMPGRRPTASATGRWSAARSRRDSNCRVRAGAEGLVAGERSGHALRLLLIEAAAGVLNCVLVPPRPGTKPADRRQQGMRRVGSVRTRAGTVGKTLRVTSPSRSSPRSVKVSIRCEILPSERRNSLKRLGPFPSMMTTRTVHLSPTRDSTSLTAPGAPRVIPGYPVSSMCLLAVRAWPYFSGNKS